MSWDVFAEDCGEPYFRHFRQNEPGYRELTQQEIDSQWVCRDQLNLVPSAPPAGALPEGSYYHEIAFALERPFSSRDTPSYYAVENSLYKDPTFRMPIVSGSSWKGALRAAAIDELAGELRSKPTALEQARKQRVRLWNLFGSEKGKDHALYESGTGNSIAFLNELLGDPATQEFRDTVSDGGALDESFRSGRLHCYPTFFFVAKTELVVLNPRNKKSRAGTVPIFIETVPAGSEGRLAWLYLSFDMQHLPEDKRKQEANLDWQILKLAADAVFRLNGFGAKKSSTFGRATVVEAGGIPFPEVQS